MHSTSAQRKSSWQSQQLSSVRSKGSGRADHGTAHQSDQSLDRQDGPQENSHRGASTTGLHSAQERWWHVHLFRGMVNDVKRRAPYYWSDWTDAWDYRVVPATVYMYFAKYACSDWLNQPLLLRRTVSFANNQCSILPALAFSLDMFEKTSQSYGVNEVLLASVLGAFVFSLFAAQPLVIVGVTGKKPGIYGHGKLN